MFNEIIKVLHFIISGSNNQGLFVLGLSACQYFLSANFDLGCNFWSNQVTVFIFGMHISLGHVLSDDIKVDHYVTLTLWSQKGHSVLHASLFLIWVTPVNWKHFWRKKCVSSPGGVRFREVPLYVQYLLYNLFMSAVFIL